MLCGCLWYVSALFYVPSDPHTRLVGGRNQYEGRVEVYRSGEWQTVCDDSWDIKEAEVVCRQLGYGYAVLAIHNAAFGEGSGRQWEGEWHCNGNETSLDDCSNRNASCSHSDDASVICSGTGKIYNTCRVWHFTACHSLYNSICSDCDCVWLLRLCNTHSPTFAALSHGALRLVDTFSTPFGGRLEFYSDHFNEWGTVCGGIWNSSDAAVACRQLGFVGVSDGNSSRFGAGTSSQRIWLYNVECSGSESRLIDCSNVAIGFDLCSHNEAVGIVCTNGELGWDVSSVYITRYIHDYTLVCVGFIYTVQVEIYVGEAKVM